MPKNLALALALPLARQASQVRLNLLYQRVTAPVGDELLAPMVIGVNIVIKHLI
jgi:hypothetical protein